MAIVTFLFLHGVDIGSRIFDGDEQANLSGERKKKMPLHIGMGGYEIALALFAFHSAAAPRQVYRVGYESIRRRRG